LVVGEYFLGLLRADGLDRCATFVELAERGLEVEAEDQEERREAR